RTCRRRGRSTCAARGWRGCSASADTSSPSARRMRSTSASEDLIEEVARIHGYDAIPARLPGGATRLVEPSETRVAESDARRQLAARDYLEAVNYAFVDAALLAKWDLAGGQV